MGEKFEYKYTAPTQAERKEIDSIRSQYLPKDKTMTKLERLRKLNNKVNGTPMALSLTIGIIGILTFGLGLTFFLEWTSFWYVGIPCSLIGIILMLLAYPAYQKILQKYKNKYGPEIIELSNELLKDID